MPIQVSTLELINTYPRRRAPLPAAHAQFYHREIVAGREGLSLVHRLVLWVESWMHKMVAKKTHGDAILELGAGTLNHLSYEKTAEIYDVVEPFNYDYSNTSESITSKIRSFYCNLNDIPPHQKYDRIISIAVLEHVETLPQMIAQSALKLNSGGIFQAGIPSEGEFLWHVCSHLSTGILYRLRTGLDYSTLMEYEHISRASEIIQIIEYFFEEVRIEHFPLSWKTASIYTYIEAKKPILVNCQAYVHHD